MVQAVWGLPCCQTSSAWQSGQRIESRKTEAPEGYSDWSWRTSPQEGQRGFSLGLPGPKYSTTICSLSSSEYFDIFKSSRWLMVIPFSLFGLKLGGSFGLQTEVFFFFRASGSRHGGLETSLPIVRGATTRTHALSSSPSSSQLSEAAKNQCPSQQGKNQKADQRGSGTCP